VFAAIGKDYASYLSGELDDVRLYNRALTGSEAKDLYISTNQRQTGDCLDSSGTYSPLTRRYKDTDNDGYSDGTVATQCAQPAGYKLASALKATSGDCDDTNFHINPLTVRYRDADADGFFDGTTQVQCTDPGATRYAGYELIQLRNTNYVVTGNLQLFIDAGDPRSYSGSATIRSDISSNNRQVTMYDKGGTTYSLQTPGVPTYTGDGYGSFKFDGVNDFGKLSTQINAGSQITVSTRVKTSYTAG